MSAQKIAKTWASQDREPETTNVVYLTPKLEPFHRGLTPLQYYRLSYILSLAIAPSTPLPAADKARIYRLAVKFPADLYDHPCWRRAEAGPEGQSLLDAPWFREYTTKWALVQATKRGIF